MNNKVWSPKTYDYSTGVLIYDPYTSRVYSEGEAKTSPAHIRRRLCVMAKVCGCWVEE